MPDCLIKAESCGPRLKERRERLTKRASAEGNQPPINFSVRNLQPGYARRRAAIRPGHATGIQKKNSPASFISRHVRVTVQENIDIVRWLIGRNVLKTEFQSAADKIDDQWPFEIAVAISAYVSDSGSNRAKLTENAFHTNISKMPDFVCSFTCGGRRLCVSARTKMRSAFLDVDFSWFVMSSKVSRNSTAN
jgi:hypothetical protein